MREQVRDRGRLEHILQAIDKVFEFTKDVKREDFKKDSILYFAIVKNIEIIGEASYMLSLDFKDAHPADTNWKVIVAMRHYLVHGYYQVDPEVNFEYVSFRGQKAPTGSFSVKTLPVGPEYHGFGTSNGTIRQTFEQNIACRSSE